VGDCVEAVSTITFWVKLQMSRAEFEVEATRAPYISGVATALGVAETSVSIVSVVEETTGRRRKLLLTSVAVETSVIVSAEQAETVADRITTDNLNSALSSAGLAVEEVSSVSIVTESAALPAGAVFGIAFGGVALVAAAFLGCRRRRAKVCSNEDLQEMVEAVVKELGDKFQVGGDGKFAPLVFGKFDEATTALEDFLCVDSDKHLENMTKREFAIVGEVAAHVADVRGRRAVLPSGGTAADPLGRVLAWVDSRVSSEGEDQLGTEAEGALLEEVEELDAEQRALLKQAEQLEECLNYVLYEEAGASAVVFDNGGLRRDCDKEGNLLPERTTEDGRGMRFEDFVNHKSAKTAGLRREQVLPLTNL